MISPLPPRQPTSYKGDYGHVLVVAGDTGMGGAACLAAEAALRVGAGLVSAITRSEHVSPLLARCPEIMCHGISDAKNLSILSELLKKATVCVIGPGFGDSSWCKRLFDVVLKQIDLPCVVDGGALRLLSETSLTRDNWVLTPHPGEAGGLLHLPVADIQKARVDAVKELQQQHGGVAVLKGAGTLVCGGNVLPIYTNDSHNPAMATAGMGDVLSGILGGLIAQGCSLFEAASYGVWLHAHAGELALKETKRRVLLAHELFPYLPLT
jgi:hydroxyethylthiazole kinase-like uncharacterized protein yjeF